VNGCVFILIGLKLPESVRPLARHTRFSNWSGGASLSASRSWSFVSLGLSGYLLAAFAVQTDSCARSLPRWQHVAWSGGPG